MPEPRRLTSRAVVGSQEAVRPTPDLNLTHQRALVEAVPLAPRQSFSEGLHVINKDKYNKLVVELLKLPGSAKPQDTLRVFVVLLGYIEEDTAFVTLTRKQFAEHCGIAETSVSTAMTNLEKFGLIRRSYSRRVVTYHVEAGMLVDAPPELPGLERSSLPSKEGKIAS